MSERIVNSDVSDQATATEERQPEDAIAAAKIRTGKQLRPVGECYACGAAVNPPKLFCDHLCADDHADFERRGLM